MHIDTVQAHMMSVPVWSVPVLVLRMVTYGHTWSHSATYGHDDTFIYWVAKLAKRLEMWQRGTDWNVMDSGPDRAV